MKKVLIFSFLFVCLIVVWIYKSNLDEQFKIALISEIIGSGLLGLFITFISLLLQDRMRDSIRKEEALNLIESIILPALKEINVSGPTIWSLYDNEIFLLQGTIIKPLHSFYKENILNLRKVFNFNSDIENRWNQFNDLVSLELIHSKKLDEMINQRVRTYHHSKGINISNDRKISELIRATLVDLPKEEIIKFLDVNESFLNERDVIVSQVKGDAEILSLIEKILENKETLKGMCLGILKPENYYLK